MPVIGVRIDKRSDMNPKFNNRYFLRVANLSSALIAGVNIAQYERLIFGAGVELYNVHAWIPGASPKQFDNAPISLVGNVGATTPLADWICAEVTFGVQNNYPNYKCFRTQVSSSLINGTSWASAYKELLDTFCSNMEGYEGTLVSADDNDLGVGVANPKYQPMQVGKRWYNRTVTP